MTLRNLGVLAAILLCGCALIGAGCGSAETTTTTYLIDTGVTNTTEPPTETSEPASSDVVATIGSTGRANAL
jgi:hypothetical protein